MSDGAAVLITLAIYATGGVAGVATRAYLEAIWLAEKHEEDRLRYPSLYAPGSKYPMDKATIGWPECLVGWFFAWPVMFVGYGMAVFARGFVRRGWKRVEQERIARVEEKEIDRIIAEQP